MAARRVLVVEDSTADQKLIREALKDIAVDLSFVSDGEQALGWLATAARVPGGHELPALVLLDLNLPKTDGRQVLAKVKKDAKLARIPVIAFSTSNSPDEVGATYDLHANCYLVKPLDYSSLATMIRQTIEYWLNVVQLPQYV